MKILHIVPTYNPAFRRGGPIVSVHNLNKWLVKKGVDVTVYTTDIDTDGKAPIVRISKNGPENELMLDGVRVYFFRSSFPRIWEYSRVGFVPAFWSRHWEYSRDLHRALKATTDDFDIVHITSTFLFASILGAWYARKNNKPYIISPRGNLMEPLELKSPLKKQIYIALIERWALKGATLHFTVPKEKIDYEKYRLPQYRSAIVIPNSIEEEEFRGAPKRGHFRERFNVGSKKKIVLFLGRLNWKKGLDTLVPAFARVVRDESEALLVIVGGDEDGYRRNIEKWVDDNKIRPNVLFTDMLVGKEKLGVLRDADLFVLPSYSENFGMSVIEAMYFGLPVVLTPNVGLSPYVEKAGAGIVVPKDIGKLAEAILGVLKNPELAKEMGENGKELVKEKFTSDRVARDFIEAYGKILKNYRKQ